MISAAAFIDRDDFIIDMPKGRRDHSECTPSIDDAIATEIRPR
jgi:hypothetical protein